MSSESSYLAFGEEDVDWLIANTDDIPESCSALLASATAANGGVPVVTDAFVFRDCFERRIEAASCNGGGIRFSRCEGFPNERLLGDPLCEKYYAFWDSLQACIDKNGPQELLTGECFTVFRVDDYGSSCGPYTCHVWEDPSCLDEPY